MKKHNKQKNIRFKATWQSQASNQQVGTMKPEDLVVYIRRAEKEVLPIIEKMQLSPAAAQFLLAQYTSQLVTGSNELSEKDAMNSANIVLSLWKDGRYVPGPKYPFTLEETLQEIKGGLKAKKEYSDSFQAFTPTKREQPRGIGRISGGIVKHPETNFWQIWMIVDGPCTYFGAYREPEEAQRNLEEIIQMARTGGTEAESKVLYQQVQSRGSGQPKQLPFDMMAYLLEHIHLYIIML